jgi:hypothetical protein
VDHCRGSTSRKRSPGKDRGVDFNDPNFNQRPYDKWEAYGQSKSANSLFAVELGVLKGPDWLKNIEQGAATTVWCAVSPQLNNKGGVYCENCDIAPILPADSKLRSGVRPWAVDKPGAEALWVLSRKLAPISAGSIA